MEPFGVGSRWHEHHSFGPHKPRLVTRLFDKLLHHTVGGIAKHRFALPTHIQGVFVKATGTQPSCTQMISFIRRPIQRETKLTIKLVKEFFGRLPVVLFMTEHDLLIVSFHR
jgi:hypothetical protein